MRFHFHAGAEASELDLRSALWTVGGGPADGVRIAGLPTALLQLAVTPGSVWLRGARPLRVGRAPLDPRTWRLLLPGEAVDLGAGRTLRLPPAPAAGTEELLRALALDLRPLPRCAAAVLVAVAGPDAGETFSLPGPSADVGRLEAAPVCLRDRAVSRRQLRLVRLGEGHRAEPCPGPNPVRCNGRRLRAPVLLREGDVLGVGRTLLCYFPPAPDVDGGPPRLTSGGTGRPAPPAAPSIGGAG
jgi:Inner membrane component of T3SS, cytoplasmic domain